MVALFPCYEMLSFGLAIFNVKLSCKFYCSLGCFRSPGDKIDAIHSKAQVVVDPIRELVRQRVARHAAEGDDDADAAGIGRSRSRGSCGGG